MLMLILAGFGLALFAPAIYRITKPHTHWLLAALPIGIFLYLASYLPDIADHQSIHANYEWVPSLGINLNLTLDGLSLLMALLITGIGALIVVYAGGYLHGDPYEGRFYSFLLIFMAAMLGLALSSNLIGLFMFWELTSISSYLLIGFNHDKADSRAAALKALLVTGGGGLAMLAGFILLGIVGNSFEISQLIAQTDAIHSDRLYLPILLLISIGAFTKSAQFPFHFWLPSAMAAPTPVSAYLHSATMVKAGVFLLARLSPILAGTDEWRLVLCSVGTLTMLTGAYLSLKQHDLKRILAYSTVSSLGLLVALLGWDSKTATEAAMLFLLMHSLYKGALFMVAGTIDHETGTRDVYQLGGLWSKMPLLGLATILAALSMAGIPPLIGFIGKELVYEASLGYESGHAFSPDTLSWLFSLVALLSNAAAVVVGSLLFFKPFSGKLTETPKHPHPPPLSLYGGALLLGIVATLLGLLTLNSHTDIGGKYLIGPAASAVYGQTLNLHLHLMPSELNPMLLLSLITLIVGALLYAALPKLLPLLEKLDSGARWGPEALYQSSVDYLPIGAKRVSMSFQSGYLRSYVAWVVGAMVVLVGYTLLSQVEFPTITGGSDIWFYEAVLLVIIVVAVMMVVTSSTLLFTIPSLGVIGYSIALIFILYGAPDLAMTQFSIETLSVVLFVLVLNRLPELARLSSRAARMRDALISIAAGALITTLILFVTAEPLESPLAQFLAENSYPQAHGRNVVNVILVDFRGFDTMGEITVLATGALGIYALLKLRVSESSHDDDTEAYTEMVSVEEHHQRQKEQTS